jgi:hypothetical protein
LQAADFVVRGLLVDQVALDRIRAVTLVRLDELARASEATGEDPGASEATGEDPGASEATGDFPVAAPIR